MDHKQLATHFAKLPSNQLLQAYARPEDCQPEARTILLAEVERRGGIENIHAQILHEAQLNQQRQMLRSRIKSTLEIEESLSQFDLTQDLPLIDTAEFEAIIAEEEAQYLHDQIQQKNTSKSVALGIVGAIVGAAIGGTIFGLSMVGSKRLGYIFVFAMAAISYGCVSLFSGKNGRNIGTLLLSAFSFAAAFVIGFSIYDQWGPEEYLP